MAVDTPLLFLARGADIFLMFLDLYQNVIHAVSDFSHPVVPHSTV